MASSNQSEGEQAEAGPSIRTCPDCGAQIRRGGGYCDQCGAVLPLGRSLRGGVNVVLLACWAIVVVLLLVWLISMAVSLK